MSDFFLIIKVLILNKNVVIDIVFPMISMNHCFYFRFINQNLSLGYSILDLKLRSKTCIEGVEKTKM